MYTMLTKSTFRGRDFDLSVRVFRTLHRKMMSSTVENAVEEPAMTPCFSAVKNSTGSVLKFDEYAPFAERIKFLRNIGVSAHIDSGKTTLTERVLFYTGRINSIHEVRGKDGVGAKMDFMELEREKGITIQSAATHTKWKNFAFNVIDTPGHVDFTIEVERALRVLDGAIMVLCGVSGVQSQSITVDRQMKRYNVPRITFVNKLDRQGANPWRVIQQIRDKLGLSAAALQIPIGVEDELSGVVDVIRREAIKFHGAHGHILETGPCPEDLVEEMEMRRRELIESLADVDEFIGDKYLMEENISDDEIYTAIRRATIARTFTPVFLGSALKNKGVQPLLDGVCAFLPNPTEAENFALVPTGDSKTKETDRVPIKTAEKEPTIALAFKLEDGKFGQLTYLRVYQGSLARGSSVINTRTGKKSKTPRLVRMNAETMEDIQQSAAGDICAVFGIDCSSGDTFVDGKTGSMVTMESLYVPEPVISLAINPVKKDTTSNFSKAINRFTREDPTLRFFTDPDSQERVISGMGELHLEIYVERLKREYNCECTTGEPKVNYKETITRRSGINYVHKKQTGGSGQYAGVMGYIEPSEDGESNEFVDESVGNNIPPQYIPAVEKGFLESLNEGMLTGCPLQGVRFVLTDGKSHSVDSSELAFKAAVKGAMRQSMPFAGGSVREPIMNLEVQIPLEFQGTVISALTKRRAIVHSTTTLGDSVTMELECPLGDMFGFSTELRSMTQGKGEFSMEYVEHRMAPPNVVKKLADAQRKRQEEKLAAQK